MKHEIGTSDEEVMALFSKYAMPELEDLKCKEEKKVFRLCVSPECQKHSLICDDPQCKICGGDFHETCRCVKMQGITKLLSKISDRQKDFSLDISKIEAKFMEELHNSKVSMVKKYYLGDMEEKFLKIVEEIYQKKNNECLVGKQAQEFFNRLVKSNEQVNQHGNALLEHYHKAMQQFLKEILDLKSKLYESYVKIQDIKMNQVLDIDSKILKKTIIQTLDDIKLQNIRTKEELGFILASLDNCKKLELIFRASEHDFRAAAFHEKCGEVENTLTLVRTQFGRTIAAFTPYKWHSVPDYNWVSNAAGGTCILSLDRREKLVPTDTNYLIYNHSSYGPIFGNGNDLLICDQCNTSNGSYNATGYNHNTADKKYKNDQAAWTALSGATNGYQFRVVEYQVFRVIR